MRVTATSGSSTTIEWPIQAIGPAPSTRNMLGGLHRQEIGIALDDGEHAGSPTQELWGIRPSLRSGRSSLGIKLRFINTKMKFEFFTKETVELMIGRALSDFFVFASWRR